MTTAVQQQGPFTKSTLHYRRSMTTTDTAMSARTILENYADEMGWDIDSQLTLCLRYISNQNDNATFEDFLAQVANAERQIDGELIEGSLSVPECWAELISTVFPEDLEGIADGETHRKRVDDPKPYYDDVRRVSEQLPHDYVAEMELASGQGNYWAVIQVVDGSNDNVIFQTEPYHEPMEEVRHVAGEKEFIVNVFFDQ